MKVTNCYIERTYNLGNYESLKIGFEAILNENDKPLEVAADLESLTFQHYQNKTAKASTTVVTAPVTVTQSAPAQSPSELANLKQRQRESIVCPICGGKKKAGFDLCYRCHEEDKAQ